MATIADLLVKLSLDSSSFKRGIEDAKENVKGLASTGSNMTALGGNIVKTGGIITAAMAPAGLLYKSMISDATDLGEQQAKTNQIYGESAQIITDWAGTTSEALGISQLEALEYAGNFGNILTTMGLADGEAATYSKTLVDLAADQAAFNNMPTVDVLDKINSGLTGMYVPLKSLGIVINEDMVKTRAFEMGLADANGELSNSALVQARYALMVEQSGNAIGQFARESDGLAAQQKITSASFSDLKAELGQRLLPIMLKIVSGVQKLIDWFSGLSPAVQNTVLVVGGFLIVLGPLLVILGALITSVGTIITFLSGPAIAAIGGAISAALPVVGVIAGIIAVVALLKTAWDNNWGGIQEKTAAVAAWLKNIAEKMFEGLKSIFDIQLGFIKGVWETFLLLLQGDFQGAGEKLRQTFIDTWSKIKEQFSELWNGIIDFFTNIDWAQLGKDIINGIANGLKNAAEWLYNTVKNIVGNVIDFAKGILGIASPSKVFYQMGENLNKGMALGLKATVDLPTDELTIPGAGGPLTPAAADRADSTELLASLIKSLPNTLSKSVRDAMLQAAAQ